MGSPQEAATHSPSSAPKCSGRTVRAAGFPWWASGRCLAPRRVKCTTPPGYIASVWPRCRPWRAWCPSPWRTASLREPRCLQKCRRNARPGRARVQRKVESRRTCWASPYGGSVCWSRSPPPSHKSCWCRRHFLPSGHGGWCCFHAVVYKEKLCYGQGFSVSSLWPTFAFQPPGFDINEAFFGGPISLINGCVGASVALELWGSWSRFSCCPPVVKPQYTIIFCLLSISAQVFSNWGAWTPGVPNYMSCGLQRYCGQSSSRYC